MFLRILSQATLNLKWNGELKKKTVCFNRHSSRDLNPGFSVEQTLIKLFLYSQPFVRYTLTIATFTAQIVRLSASLGLHHSDSVLHLFYEPVLLYLFRARLSLQ